MGSEAFWNACAVASGKIQAQRFGELKGSLKTPRHLRDNKGLARFYQVSIRARMPFHDRASCSWSWCWVEPFPECTRYWGCPRIENFLGHSQNANSQHSIIVSEWFSVSSTAHSHTHTTRSWRLRGSGGRDKGSTIWDIGIEDLPCFPSAAVRQRTSLQLPQALQDDHARVWQVVEKASESVAVGTRPLDRNFRTLTGLYLPRSIFMHTYIHMCLCMYMYI